MKNSEQPINPVTPTHFTDRCGLTKREYFAGLAMQGMLANSNRELIYDELEKKIKDCIGHADELLKQLEK